MDKTIGLSLAIMISLCTLISCATANAGKTEPNSLDDLIIDPIECIEVSLKRSVVVMKEVIHEPSIMGNRFLLILRYREGGDERTYTPDLGAGYNNVSLVSEVGTATDPIIVYKRYCVIEMWKFYPKKSIKHCYLWIIADDSASMKIIVEDFGGQLIDERSIPLDAPDITKLKTFYKQLAKELVDMLKEPSPEL